jgi:hypothetical protein
MEKEITDLRQDLKKTLNNLLMNEEEWKTESADLGEKIDATERIRF